MNAYTIAIQMLEPSRQRPVKVESFSVEADDEVDAVAAAYDVADNTEHFGLLVGEIISIDNNGQVFH